MIANKLNVLLAERQLSIKDVVSGTGLSRNTISNLTNNNSSGGINLKTINKLCMFLNVTPADFFEYFPYEAEFSITRNAPDNAVGEITFDSKIEHNSTYISTTDPLEFDSIESVLYKSRTENEHTITLGTYMPAQPYDSEIAEELFNIAPVLFQTSISNTMLDLVEDFTLNNLVELFPVENTAEFDNQIVMVEFPWKTYRRKYVNIHHKFIDA